MRHEEAFGVLESIAGCEKCLAGVSLSNDGQLPGLWTVTSVRRVRDDDTLELIIEGTARVLVRRSPCAMARDVLLAARVISEEGDFRSQVAP